MERFKSRGGAALGVSGRRMAAHAHTAFEGALGNVTNNSSAWRQVGCGPAMAGCAVGD